MKIIYCSYSKIPSDTANSIAVMQQCAALKNKVDLLALFTMGDVDHSDVFKYYHVEPFSIKLLPTYSLCFRELGLKMSLLKQTLYYKPEMVYSRDVLLNSWLCKLHIPNIYEMHQLDQLDEAFDFYYKKQLRKIKDSHYLKAIICISNSLKNECIKFGIPKEKLFVLHSGVSLPCNYSGINSNVNAFCQEDKPIAMYVGSLQKGKGIETILQMAQISNKFHFVIIGGKTGEITETDHLTHIPQVSNELARKYMESADFLLLPMKEQKYRFHSPLKLFEYLCAGKVIIASDNEDLKEILKHGNNAMLANSEDPSDFLKQMEIVCCNPCLKKKLCTQAYRTASKYSWEKRAEKICEIIKERLS